MAVSRETIEQLLDDDTKESYVTKGVDHDMVALSLLRQRIPYDECKSIIAGAKHDVIYLCDLELVEKYLSEEDVRVLADCNLFIENESLAIFA